MDFYSHNISYDVYIATVQTCVRVGLSVYVPIAIVIISICMYKVVKCWWNACQLVVTTP